MLKMPCLRILLVFVAFVILNSLNSIRAQVSSDVQVKAALRHIYQLELHSADSIVRDHLSQQPDDPTWLLLDATVAWWSIISGNLENDSLNKRFDQALSKAEQVMKKTRDCRNECHFNVILIHAMRTRFELLHDNYISTVSNLNSCIDNISESFGEEREFRPFYLTSGLYYYLMEVAYEDYPLMRPYLFFFPDGDKATGLKYLEKISEEGDVFLKTEANYFLMRIFLDIESDYAKASRYASKLHQMHAENLIFHFYHLRAKWLANQGESMDAELDKYRKAVNGHNELNEAQKAFYLEMLKDVKVSPDEG